MGIRRCSMKSWVTILKFVHEWVIIKTGVEGCLQVPTFPLEGFDRRVVLTVGGTLIKKVKLLIYWWKLTSVSGWRLKFHHFDDKRFTLRWQLTVDRIKSASHLLTGWPLQLLLPIYRSVNDRWLLKFYQPFDGRRLTPSLKGHSHAILVHLKI